MAWHYWAALVAGFLLAGLVDWVFAGVLFHDKYQAHPEVWRFNGPNPRALMAAQALTIPTVVGVITLMQITASTAIIPALTIAVLVWVTAAAPAILANGLYIKLHPAIVITHTLGWLVKLAAIASAASHLLRM